MKPKSIEILYEDDYLIIVNKPAGIYSVPDRHQSEKDNLLFRLWAIDDAILPVHRLDKDTSGVICYAKEAETHQLMNTLFEERKVQKTYLALVNGIMRQAEGLIDAPIADRAGQPGTMRIHPDGKQSLTNYKVEKNFQMFTLVSMYPHTGRTHQIRVHALSIGHPLAIDPIYGTRSELRLSEIKRNYKFSGTEENPIMQRLTLHAKELKFPHPYTQELVTVTAPLPKDFHALLSQLEKWG